MHKRIYNLIALLLLGMFFLPYIIKVQEWDLAFLLIAGLALPAIEFFTGKQE